MQGDGPGCVCVWGGGVEERDLLLGMGVSPLVEMPQINTIPELTPVLSSASLQHKVYKFLLTRLSQSIYASFISYFSALQVTHRCCNIY